MMNINSYESSLIAFNFISYFLLGAEILGGRFAEARFAKVPICPVPLDLGAAIICWSFPNKAIHLNILVEESKPILQSNKEIDIK